MPNPAWQHPRAGRDSLPVFLGADGKVRVLTWFGTNIELSSLDELRSYLEQAARLAQSTERHTSLGSNRRRVSAPPAAHTPQRAEAEGQLSSAHVAANGDKRPPLTRAPIPTYYRDPATGERRAVDIERMRTDVEYNLLIGRVYRPNAKLTLDDLEDHISL